VVIAMERNSKVSDIKNHMTNNSSDGLSTIDYRGISVKDVMGSLCSKN
jgi:hypothetical protein